MTFLESHLSSCSYSLNKKDRCTIHVHSTIVTIISPAPLRFGCEKCVLVGDPKQLAPPIQGSDSAHQSGLERTLFERLVAMRYNPVVLRTQYRCHPTLSAISNRLLRSQYSLMPRCSCPPGARKSDVLNELSCHRHLSPLEFQRIQSDCSF